MNYKVKNGEVIIFPTDTVYGIAAKFHDEEAIKRIFDIKRRDPNKKIAVLVSSLEEAEKLAFFNENARIIANSYWPGALTIILKLKQEQPLYDKTIGIRIPNCLIAKKILEANGPMATTSVNISGEKPLDNFWEIKKTYLGLVDHIYEKTEESSSVSSTIVDCLEEEPKLIREGTITYLEILEKIKAN